MSELPELLSQKVARLGDQGAEWLAGLPSLIAELEQRWSITVGPALSGGTAAYVARARTADGRDAVLKLAISGLDGADQIRTLAAARGRGYARLLAHDEGREAMLLEALGPSMDTLGLSPERQIVLLCRTLREAWTVSRPATREPEKAAQLGRMVGELWDKLGRPCKERVIEQALVFAKRRAAAFDLDRCVVVHGDPHPGNALRVPAPRAGAESGFVFVDPDGFLADPAYDLGVVLRDWGPQLLAADDPVALARRYCRLLASESRLDEGAIWEWGFLERVSTGLYVLDFGAEDMARPYLATAERLTS